MRIEYGKSGDRRTVLSGILYNQETEKKAVDDLNVGKKGGGQTRYYEKGWKTVTGAIYRIREPKVN